MIIERECPECGEWNKCDPEQKKFTCIGCNETWRIDYDGEFIEGMWIDQTTLTPLGKEE